VVESEQQQCLLTIHDLLKLIIQLLSTKYNATKWVAEYGNEIGVDGKRLAVAGNSAGGNMATVVAMMAEKGPTIKLQVLFWPLPTIF
jgi:acetyl esterase/lipase